MDENDSRETVIQTPQPGPAIQSRGEPAPLLVTDAVPKRARVPGTVHLPGLNGVRFLAAAAVFVHHAEQFKGFADLPNDYTNRWVHSFGPQGVDLFFVLSGF